jgi:asparagine synthase (glutamine-hydrolysing)
MCGIVGKYNYNNMKPVSDHLMRKMSDVIAYRGPDDSGVFTEGPIGLGHRRLSIIDLSELGHQPMSTGDDKIWITYNGEIYNFQVLRKDLEEKGYRFRSDCDTEVILYLYREYGYDFLERLRGMFAFAIWDSESHKLILARDRIGKKPLYYFHDDKTLVFASEIKAILQDPHVRREVNIEGFCDYFHYLYVPDPKTIFKNIYKLQPGHFLVCDTQGISTRQYWDISFAQTIGGSRTEIARNLLKTLDESVRLRMISDVPLGAFLSGGIDSSGVVALMAAQQASPVTTCSIDFDSDEYDEITFARMIAQRFRTDHHEFTVKQKAAEILGVLAFHFDEPFADSSAVPTYYVSKLARQLVTVALAGDGGDENFAGYEKYSVDEVENRFRKLIPRLARQPLFPLLAAALNGSTNRFLRKGRTLFQTLSYPPDYGFYLSNSHFDHVLWNRCVRDDVKQHLNGYDPSEITRRYYNQADTDDHLSRILYTDLKTYLPGDILVKVDRMSMAHSLEVRAPLLDHKVVELAASIKPELKFHRGEKKLILKEAFDNILPTEVMHRKKMGFCVPMEDWLRGEIKEVAYRTLFVENRGLQHFFRMTALHELWEQHQGERQNYATLLWALLMFELWWHEYMK